MELRVPEREAGSGGESGDQREIALVEAPLDRALVEHLDNAQDLILRLERRGDHRTRGEPRRLVDLVNEALVGLGISHQFRLARARDVPDDASAQRELESLDPLPHRTAGEATDHLVAGAQPDRAGFRLEDLKGAVEDAWE